LAMNTVAVLYQLVEKYYSSQPRVEDRLR
jgi:hypothetical protein